MLPNGNLFCLKHWTHLNYVDTGDLKLWRILKNRISDWLVGRRALIWINDMLMIGEGFDWFLAHTVFRHRDLKLTCTICDLFCIEGDSSEDSMSLLFVFVFMSLSLSQISIQSIHAKKVFFLYLFQDKLNCMFNLLNKDQTKQGFLLLKDECVPFHPLAMLLKLKMTVTFPILRQQIMQCQLHNSLSTLKMVLYKVDITWLEVSIMSQQG